MLNIYNIVISDIQVIKDSECSPCVCHSFIFRMIGADRATCVFSFQSSYPTAADISSGPFLTELI
jgi:hypothetical protein